MAGRIWTKGVAWKKAAAAILAENSHVNSIPVFEREERILSFSSTTTTSISKDHSLSGFSDNIMGISKSHLSLSALSRRSSANVAKQNYVKGNILRKLEIRDLFLNAQHRPSFQQNLRHYSSTSNTDSKSESSDAPKVGIISSMFNEGQNEAETKAKEEVASEDKSKQENSEGSGDGKKKSDDPFMRSQRYAKWMLIGTFSFGIPLLIYEFGPPRHDEEGKIILDEFSEDPLPVQYIKRACNQLNLMKKDIVEPSSQKLLPDPLQAPYYQPPYTLVIELFDVLLHPVYDSVHGWRFKKRPGIDYFLEQVGPPLYEIVVFTRENGMVAYPLVDSMDPKGYIMYRLFRDAARFKSGFQMGNIFKGELPKLDPYYQKDITYLNRDLRRVIVVDNDKRATELQPSNGISLKPWDGSSTDTEIFDLAAFLRTVATNEVDDVRPVLEHYRKYDDPLAAFKLAQVRMHEEQLKLAREMQESRKKSLLPNSKGGGAGFSVLTNFFRSRN